MQYPFPRTLAFVLAAACWVHGPLALAADADKAYPSRPIRLTNLKMV